MLEHCGSLGGELLRCSVRSDCVVGSNISSAPPKSNMSSLGIAETNFKAGNWPESVSLHRFRRGYPQPDEEEKGSVISELRLSYCPLPCYLRRRVKSLQLRLETLDLLSAELCQDSALTN
jgi:hypothetical protein